MLWTVALGIAVGGCGRKPVPTASNLPPAYTRDKILDPVLEEAGRSFSAWATEQRAGGEPVFASVTVLPAAPTLLPYGVGTYQKENRLPAVLITGPGWRLLSRDAREAIAARTFDELSRLLRQAATKSRLQPTITIQTPQGLELAWINDRQPGRALLHGEDK
jgi:hypothetical protein